MSRLTRDDVEALRQIEVHCGLGDGDVECSPVLACNYKLLFVAKYGCEGLIWLVDQERITLDKAYRTALKAEGWDQLELLQSEFLETGDIEGMSNKNDVFMVPDELVLTTMDKIVKE